MNATSETAERVYVSAEAAEAFTRQIMLAHGLPEQDAAIVAHCLVSADLRGVDTHGIARLPGLSRPGPARADQRQARASSPSG